MTPPIFARNQIAIFYPFIAFAGAIGAAFYWIPYHNYCTTYTHNGNRQVGMSFLGILGNFIMLLSPLVSGFVTSKFHGMTGYIIIFSISLASFVLTILSTRKLPSTPMKNKKHPMSRMLKRYITNKTILFVAIGHMFYGFRDGIYNYFLGIAIFKLVNNEMVVGINIASRSIVAIATFFLITKLINAKYRYIGNYIILVLGLALSIVLTLWYCAIIIMIVYIIDASLQSYANNTLQFSTYDAVDYANRQAEKAHDASSSNKRESHDASSSNMREVEDFRIEIIALRNGFLNIGRVLGILFFLFVPFTQGSVLPIVFLNAMAIISGIFVHLSSEKKSAD